MRTLLVAILLLAATIPAGLDAGIGDREALVRRDVRPVAAVSLHRDQTGLLTCGTVSCSYYVNRRATHSVATAIDDHGNTISIATGGVIAAGCWLSGAGPLLSIVCATIGGLDVATFLDNVHVADKRNACIRLVNSTAEIMAMLIAVAPTLVTPLAPVVAPPAIAIAAGQAVGTTVSFVDDSGYCENG